jgi:hypothetical protein
MTSRRPSLSFIPPLLPNQTIYYWVAVFHEMSGNATVDETRLQLFGSAKAGQHFHIPSHLDTFCASTQLMLGTTEALVRIATTLPYYTQFSTPNVAARVLEQVRGKSAYGGC